MSKKKNPPKWVNVYPQGTKEGDEEQKLFISLARHPKYEWRSVSAMSAESGLTKKRVEEILAKYYKKGMVFQNPKNEEQWGYWERVPHMLSDNDESIVEKEQKSRIDSVAGGNSPSCGSGGCGSCGRPGGGCCTTPSVVYKDDSDVGSLAATKYYHPDLPEWIPIRTKAEEVKAENLGVEKWDFNKRVFYIDVKSNDEEYFIEKLKKQFELKNNRMGCNSRTYPRDVLEESIAALKEDSQKLENEKPLDEVDDMAYFRRKMTTPMNFPLMKDALKVYHCTRSKPEHWLDKMVEGDVYKCVRPDGTMLKTNQKEKYESIQSGLIDLKQPIWDRAKD